MNNNKDDLYTIMYNVMYKEIDNMKNNRYKQIMESKKNKVLCLEMLQSYNDILGRLKYLEESKKDLEIDFYKNFNLSINDFNKLYLEGE